jgi:tripartite-type tricarboxylate transporter receptor subunit TctC
MSDLIGGQVDMMFDNISSSLGQYKGGRIKLLAVASTQRAPSIPEVPTMQESGLPNFQSGTWVAVVAPPGTPVAITNAIRDAMAEAVRMPDVKQRFADLGGEAVGDTSAQLATFLSEERARWADVIKRAHVSID